ncbi:MAG: TIGR01459 family HAD-type hydrolase, partial [Pseudomonadota bacterium]
ADLMAQYDAVICDVWGVVHNGRTAYTDACERLTAYREDGGRVILLSNAPRSADTVADILREKNVPDDCWDAIMSSGEISIREVAARGYQCVHHIGPSRDDDLFDQIAAARVPLKDAQAIVATGLIHDRTETGEDYRDRLRDAASAKLPLICANPDLVVDVGGTLLPCAGSIAAVYEDLGGPVYWAGKPHADAYRAALACLSDLLARAGDAATPNKARILAIGDAERTDIAGAVRFGLDALFIGQGIHRETVMPDADTLDADAVATLFAPHPHKPIAAMASLR